MKGEVLHILLVEDSETHAALIRDALESGARPITLTEVRTLAEARAALTASTPDLSIIDLFLPDGKGTELLAPVLEESAFPAIIMTGHGDEQAAVEAIKAGALDYVVKTPAALAEMPRVLERSLREWNQVRERRRAEEALKRSEAFFRSVLDSMHDAICIIDVCNYRIVGVNRVFLEEFGLTEIEVMGRPCHEVIHASSRPCTPPDHRCPMVDTAETGSYSQVEHVHVGKGGKRKHVEVSTSPIRDEHGKVVRVVHAARDITDRKEAEIALSQSRNQFQDLVETINDWVWELDGKGVYTYASPRIRELLGYVPEEVVGKTPFDFMPEEEARRISEIFREIIRQRIPFAALENLNLHRDGHAVVLETSGVPFFDEEGELLGFRGVDRDITERKAIEERLKEANRELEAFVYTVSHDLRAPLTPILGYADLLRENYGERLDEQGRDFLEEIRSAGKRTLSLIQDLLAIARVGYLERPAGPVDAKELVAETLKEMGSRIAEVGASVRVEPLPAVHVPETLLAQIFTNLIGNALRYGEQKGGRVEVGGERRGERVRIFVRDHGPGIPENERERIFDLFFRGSTGKGVQGTGVGLAIVQKIARFYGGRAWVEETPGGGATFLVELVDSRAQEPSD